MNKGNEMKSLRGLTLIEVVTALAITAILLPVMGLVFYNMLTTPPEQTTRLTLNNEVALLAQWLYYDTHHADSFTVGNGSPIYGNFSWTDYSQINPLGGYNEYLVSYSSTCPEGSDPDCSNRVVREVLLINGSTTWPTATPTSTATATPTPTSTEIPDEQTYTYCSGGGSDKWAWARAWNNTEWFTQGHPTDPDDFFDDYDREIETAGSSDYALICTANNESWSEPDTDSPIDYGVSSQLYTIDVAQDRDDVSELGVTWRGYGGIATQNVKLEIWNYTTSAWTSIVDESDPDSRNNDTYTWDTSSSPENYIEESTGYVTMLASADADETIPGEFDFGTSLYFNGSASNTMTANSSVPTDTFTFEAWVKCTEEITLYSPQEATSGTQGCADQHYLFWPTHGGAANAGVGLSVGTNGISVYEHGDGYLPPLATYEGNLGTAWNHIAVVYSSNVAKIYLNGNLVRTGLASTKTTAYAPYILGYGNDWGSGPSYFTGWVDEVRLWNIALNQSQIQDNMYTENPTAAGTATVTEVYTSNDYFEPPDGVEEVEVLVVGGGGGGGGSVYGGPTGNGMGGGGGGAGGVVYNSSYALGSITQVEIFTSSGTWTAPDDVTSVEILVVGGGGGGGGFTSGSVGGGGGGGGGGFRTDDDYTVTPGNTYTITVGAGGTAGADGADGGNGGNSAFDSFTAAGGGGGASSGVADNDGNAGGSGGGGRRGGGGYGVGGAGNTPSTSPVQGYNGGDGGHTTGDGSGGGGGASEVGERLDTADGGDGGDGAASSITGTSVYYAGGGGGGGQGGVGGAGGLGGGASAFASRCAGLPGTNGLGGGGSGATASGSGDAYSGGAGGSGVVIVKYTSSRMAINVGAGGTGGTATVCHGAQGSDGSPSVFGDIIANGGGGGGGGSSINQLTTCVGRDGGSGGGAGAGSYQINSNNVTTAGGSGTAGQGSDGGDGNYDCCMVLWCTCPQNSAGGGGGGADAAGGNAVDGIAGSGGAGDNYSSIFGAVGGASGWFGGGGGGGAYPGYTKGSGGSGGGGAGGVGNTVAIAGTANTGGGGGGAGVDDSPLTYVSGAAGGSGFVIVQYEVPGANLVGLWHFNDCYVDILDDVMEDSSTYDNDGALSSPGPECSLGVSSDLTLYTDYIALDVTTPGDPVPTVEPRPTDTYPTSTYTPQVAAATGCLAGDAEITSPTDTCTACGGYGGGWTAAGSTELSKIASDDGTYWVTEYCPAALETNYQRYYVTIGSDIAIANISQIGVRIQGYGDSEGISTCCDTTAKIWKYTGSTWETIGTRTDQTTDWNFDKSITTGISNYFSGKTLALLFKTVDDSAVPCPRMYGWDGELYQFIDSAASGHILKRYSGTNYPATSVLTPNNDGYYDLMVRGPSRETSYLDRLGLTVVDHPENTEVIADETGAIHTVSEPRTITAVDSNGYDVTSLLAVRDGNVWGSDVRSRDFSDESQFRDWIELTLPDIPQTDYFGTSMNYGTAKLVITGHYSTLSMLEVWGWYTYILGSPNHAALMQRAETDEQLMSCFDYTLWNLTSVNVEVWDGSEWQYYTTVELSDGSSHIALLNLKDIPGNRIRLSIPAGAFSLDYVAVDYSSDKPVTVTELQPAEAYQFSYSPSGSLTTADVLQNISAEDGSYAILHLDEWLNYKFEALDYAPADGMTRSFLIPCTGYYIPEGPEVAEDKSENLALSEQLACDPVAYAQWVYPRYADWLNNGSAYDCNDYDWAYCSAAPFPVREDPAWDRHSVNTDHVRVTITQYLAYRTLTISAGTGGNVSPAAPGDYYFINTVVPITATVEEECYEFDAWTGDTAGIADVNDPTTTITMNADYSITATFNETTDTYALSLASDPEGAGYPYFAGSSPFECGTDVAISAAPNPGYTFLGWTPTDGVANASLEDTTVHMTQARTLTAQFNGSGSLPTATPTPELVQESALYLTQHVQVDNFRLISSDDLIIAEIESGMNTSMGDYVTKTLTLYLRMRPSYQLPEESIWGEDSVSILGGLLFSGDYNSISGNVKVNGTVTIDAAAEYNDIDGTLTCPEIVWEGGSEDEDQLSYTQLITQNANNEMPDMGDPQLLFKANLSVGTTDWAEADVIHQYVFTGDVNFTQVGSDAYVHCWADLDNHELKEGLYYSPGTITLATTWDGPTSGTVTFIAGEQIIISNGQDWGWITDPTIRLTAYNDELLFWANGSTADPELEDGVILVTGNSDWHACASLEGVMFAPNGEIELAGGGAEGWFGYIMPAELYEGALIGQYLTLSGSHWNFYRW